MASGLKEFYYVFYKQEDSKQEPRDEISKIPFSNEKNTLIDKKRALKRWKQSFGYYSLNPERFNFTLKDL
ncbi:MAG: hypothetical protein HWN81_14590 [Candidatus Lokiarchaeota archaeon]|nr:hypothetical protein [Candidatus Lokiarchaeota archaeon]